MDSRHNRFRHARRVRGLTQRETARLFDVDPQTVSRWERGESPLTLPTLEEASRLFNVDRVWLVFGQGAPPQALPTDPPPSSVDDDDDDDDEPVGEQPREGVA
jgi:transcriptional regulator with XRE-family HTH domain